MRKSLFILGILLLFSFFSRAQQWDWANVTYTASHGYSINADKLGNVYVTGSYSNFSNSNNSFNYPFYLKLDSMGNELIRKQPVIYPGQAITDKNGNMYYLNNSYIVKLDSTGEQVWAKQHLGYNLLNLTFNPTGGIMVVARYLDSTLTKTAFFKMDFDGNIIWQRLGDFSVGFTPFACNHTGASYWYGMEKQTNNTWNGSVLITDKNGVLTNTIFAPAYAVDIAVDQQRSVIIAGNLSGTMVFNGQSYTKDDTSTVYLVKYDSAGAFKWVKFLKGANIELPCLATDTKNNVYLGGSFVSMLLDGVRYYLNGRGSPFVAKINTTGTTEFVSHGKYVGGPVGSGSPKAMRLTQNNKILLTGSLSQKLCFGNDTVSTGNYPNLLVVQLNLLKTTVGLQNKNTQEGKLTVYPNPANGIITLQTNYKIKNVELRIENIFGQLVYLQKINTGGNLNETIDLSKYPKGLYFVQINTANASDVRKIVLE